MAETIPGPLLDRMESSAGGATTEEKVAIARGYLWPRQVRRNGLRPEEVEVGDDVLRMVITEYTREAGVRQLSASSGPCSKDGSEIASQKAAPPVTVDLDRAHAALGRQEFFRSRRCGPRSGCRPAWQSQAPAGDVLFIEGDLDARDRSCSSPASWATS